LERFEIRTRTFFRTLLSTLAFRRRLFPAVGILIGIRL
jgi:hypothetical protein